MDNENGFYTFIDRYQNVLQQSNEILKNQFSNQQNDRLRESVMSTNCKDHQSCYIKMKHLELKHVQLHSYQLCAIEWMLLRYRAQLGCIIADEMGLGKTLQTLGFLSMIKKSSIVTKPTTSQCKNSPTSVCDKKFLCLVLCPLSVIPIWSGEVHQYWPSCKILVYSGTKDERATIRNRVELERLQIRIDEKNVSPWNVDNEAKIANESNEQCSRNKSEKKKNDSFKRHNVDDATEVIMDHVDNATEVIMDHMNESDKCLTVKNFTKESNTCSSSDVSYDLIVTSYEIFLKDSFALLKLLFTCVVVDEAHRLKSSEGLLYNLLMNSYIKKPQIFKVLLTGTPLQNNMKEFWSLLHFILPNILPNVETATPILEKIFDPTSTTGTYVSKLVQLMMLRRRRDQIPNTIWNLPDKIEFDLYVPLTPLQRSLYLALLSKDPEILQQLILWKRQQESQSNSNNVLNSKKCSITSQPFHFLKGSLNNMLAQLRKCANHPYLFPNVEPEPFIDGPHLWMSSGKLIVLEKLLNHFKALKSRVLLFSNSTQMLDIIQDYLELRGDSFERLDGSIRGTERTEAINRFTQSATFLNPENRNSSMPSTFVFLLSSRAGGVGINLSVADVVIFMDVDWNPQIDLQALSRAYRQGQTKQVKIIRLVAQDTVDEVIRSRAKHKLEFTSGVLGEDVNLTGDERVNVGALAEALSHGVDKLTAHEELKPELVDAETIQNDPFVIAMMSVPIETILERGKLKGERIAGGSENIPGSESRCSSQKSLRIDTKNNERGLYQFEGKDYKQASTAAQSDAALGALEKLLIDCETRKRVLKVPRRMSISIEAKQSLPQLSNVELQEERELRQMKREASWISNYGYRSYSIKLDETISEKGELDFDFEIEGDPFLPELHHVSGDATRPKKDPPCVVLHCVDASGRWPNAGFFAALRSRFGLFIQTYYELAGKLHDLKLGDLHFIPVPRTKTLNEANIISENGENITSTQWIALLIGQRRHDRRRCRDSIVLDMNAFKQGLLKLYQAMKSVSPNKNHACPTLHAARIGTIEQWYGLERLIQRYIVQYGIDTWIYYFRKKSTTDLLSSSRSLTDKSQRNRFSKGPKRARHKEEAYEEYRDNASDMDEAASETISETNSDELELSDILTKSQSYKEKKRSFDNAKNKKDDQPFKKKKTISLG